MDHVRQMRLAYFATDRATDRADKCNAVKRNGQPCRQSTDLDSDGYCKYHQSPKYKTAQPSPPRIPVSISKRSEAEVTPAVESPDKTEVTPAVESPDEIECNICCAEFPSHESWRLMGFGCCAYKMCRTCAEKVDNCPGCRTSTPNLQRSTGRRRMPRHVTEGDHQVAADLDAQLNSSSTSISITIDDPPAAPPAPPVDHAWIETFNKWDDASIRDKRRAILSFNFLINGSPVEIGRLIKAMQGYSESRGGLNVTSLKHMLTCHEGPDWPLRAGGRTRDLIGRYLITKFVSVLG